MGIICAACLNLFSLSEIANSSLLFTTAPTNLPNSATLPFQSTTMKIALNVMATASRSSSHIPCRLSKSAVEALLLILALTAFWAHPVPPDTSSGSAFFPSAEGAIISSSELELCTNDGSETIPCSKKFVVSVSINSDQDNTEYVTFLRSATDAATGQRQTLSDPIRIAVKKSSPMIRYPITYVQNFNNKPYELSLTTGALKCKAAASDDDPTCGRAFDSNGAAIKYSEGYCCDCSICSLFGVCSSKSRANINCALFGDGAAATCLSFDPLWYSGYRIGAAQTWYTITVTVSNSKKAQTMTLGPDKLGAVNLDFGVTAQLIGDFAAFKTAPSFNNKYMMVPAYPPSNVRVKESTPGKEWMLVDTDRVTLDGSECNKIGISYSAMVTQGSRCQAISGSCTQSQIDDFRAADLTKEAQGLSGSYMMRNFGNFVYISPGDSSSSVSDGTVAKEDIRHLSAEAMEQPGFDVGQFVDILGMRAEKRRMADNRDNARLESDPFRSFGAMDSASTMPYVAYYQDSVQASLLTLTFAADNVSYTVNVAPGAILSYNISSYAANTQNGKLSVIIINNGSIAADFSLTVTGCSAGTLPLTAQVSTLGALSIKEFIFDIYSSITTGGSTSCNITLYNSLFLAIDKKLASWSVKPQDQDNGAQGGNASNGGGGSPNSGSSTSKGSSESCTSCPFYNPVCFVTKSCFWQVVVQVLVGVAILVGLCLLFKFRQPLMKFASWVAKGSGDKIGSPSKQKVIKSKNSGRDKRGGSASAGASVKMTSLSSLNSLDQSKSDEYDHDARHHLRIAQGPHSHHDIRRPHALGRGHQRRDSGTEEGCGAEESFSRRGSAQHLTTEQRRKSVGFETSSPRLMIDYDAGSRDCDSAFPPSHPNGGSSTCSTVDSIADRSRSASRSPRSASPQYRHADSPPSHCRDSSTRPPPRCESPYNGVVSSPSPYNRRFQHAYMDESEDFAFVPKSPRSAAYAYGGDDHFMRAADRDSLRNDSHHFPPFDVRPIYGSDLAQEQYQNASRRGSAVNPVPQQQRAHSSVRRSSSVGSVNEGPFPPPQQPQYFQPIYQQQYPHQHPRSPMAESIDRMSLSMQDSVRSSSMARSFGPQSPRFHPSSSRRVPHDPFSSFQSMDGGGSAFFNNPGPGSANPHLSRRESAQSAGYHASSPARGHSSLSQQDRHYQSSSTPRSGSPHQHHFGSSQPQQRHADSRRGDRDQFEHIPAFHRAAARTPGKQVHQFQEYDGLAPPNEPTAVYFEDERG